MVHLHGIHGFMVKLWSFGHPNMKWYILTSWIFAMVAPVNGGMTILQLFFGPGSRTIFRSTMGLSQAAMFDGSSINFVPQCHPQHIACTGFVGALFWPVEVFNHNQTTANPPWNIFLNVDPKPFGAVHLVNLWVLLKPLCTTVHGTIKTYGMSNN